MTPNPESPIFIRHEIPEYACANAKKLGEIFLLIKTEAKHGRWCGITENDVTLDYNFQNGCTRINAKLIDSNRHTHHFTIQLVPDNGFGDTDEDYLCLKYLFEGEFDENVLSVRSFAEYLSIYLEWEGFFSTITHCDRGIEIVDSIDYIQKDYCKMIDIAISKFRPIEWFYSNEPKISSFEELTYFYSNLHKQLQSEADKGRWHGISSNSFRLERYISEQEVGINLTYSVDDVWDWNIYVCAVWYDTYTDMNVGASAFPDCKLSISTQRKLDALFAEFLDNLQSAKGNLCVGLGHGEHSLSHQYFHIEDSFDLFTDLVDDIIANLKIFKFQLAIPPVNLTEEMRATIKGFEDTLGTTFHIVTEEDEINKKIKDGYFKSYNA